MDKSTLKVYDDSLRRCNAREGFLDRFYENFLSSSPAVREKFARTDFERQKRALRASLHLMVLAAEDQGGGPEKYLRDLAFSHSKAGYDIGSGLYDLWLDSILKTVKEFDPQFGPDIEKAWESVMMVGIDYLLAHYNTGGGGHRVG
jgi:hemoglobin-like flavoprotein